MSPAGSQCSCQGGTADGAVHHWSLLAAVLTLLQLLTPHSCPPGTQGSSPPGDRMTQSRLEVTRARGFTAAEQAASSGETLLPISP